MGKPTGFLEYRREAPPERPPRERLGDWREFRLHLDEDRLRRQAARCMDCGTPFCHSGLRLAGTVAGCPLGNLIPEWNDLVYRGLWREAAGRLLAANNFPEFTGRVCPAPCEAACTLGLNGEPVTVRDIECAVIERAFAAGWMAPKPPPFRTGRRAAVVGSGPAGLACAAQLNQAGHEVTVFERAGRAGGLLTYGIPGMKLDKGVVQRRVDLLAAEGVRFALNTEAGRDISAARLRREYDAVVLCPGAGKPRDLPVAGRELGGIHQAVEFLGANTWKLLGMHPGGGYISAAGRDVVVIGGGDTGTDCVATALRQGCRSVVQLEILPAPPAGRSPNPWPLRSRVRKVDYGQEEAMAVFGRDPREYGRRTEKFTGGPDGMVREVHTVAVAWEEDGDGRRIPVAIPGTGRVWPAGLVLLAMGFLGPEDALLAEFGVSRDARTNIEAEDGKYAASVEGVFAAGDARRGQSLVAWAIHEGRGAAREVDRYLMGGTYLP